MDKQRLMALAPILKFRGFAGSLLLICVIWCHFGPVFAALSICTLLETVMLEGSFPALSALRSKDEQDEDKQSAYLPTWCFVGTWSNLVATGSFVDLVVVKLHPFTVFPQGLHCRQLGLGAAASNGHARRVAGGGRTSSKCENFEENSTKTNDILFLLDGIGYVPPVCLGRTELLLPFALVGQIHGIRSLHVCRFHSNLEIN